MSEDGDTRCNVCASVWSAFVKTNRVSSSTKLSGYSALIRANSERSESKKRFSDRRCSSSSIATTGATNESKNDWTNLITRAVSCDTPAVRSSCGPSAAVAAATALDTSVDRRFCVIFLHSRIPRDVPSVVPDVVLDVVPDVVPDVAPDVALDVVPTLLLNCFRGSHSVPVSPKCCSSVYILRRSAYTSSSFLHFGCSHVAPAWFYVAPVAPAWFYVAPALSPRRFYVARSVRL